MSVFI